MSRLNTKLVTTTVTTFSAIVYAVCVAFRPIFPGWAMYTTEMWAATFPGFSWTVGGVLLGLIETVVYAALGSALFVGLYNYFGKRLASAGT